MASGKSRSARSDFATVNGDDFTLGSPCVELVAGEVDLDAVHAVAVVDVSLGDSAEHLAPKAVADDHRGYSALADTGPPWRPLLRPERCLGAPVPLKLSTERS